MAVQMDSELLRFLVDHGCRQGERLPAITDLAAELGISTGKLREQLEVARTMGLVEVRPKTGIRTQGYSFLPMLKANLLFALALDPDLFEEYGVLRNHVEAAFWNEAVALLEPEDKDRLRELIDQAWEKLRGQPIQIPHDEHRQLHMTIFRRLDNLFVKALLEGYWAAYEAVGLDVYTDYTYLEQVWNYHERMVDAIVEGDFDAGYQALVEHTGLIHARSEVLASQPVGSPDGAATFEGAKTHE